jgi:hypothetical protein
MKLYQQIMHCFTSTELVGIDSKQCKQFSCEKIPMVVSNQSSLSKGIFMWLYVEHNSQTDDFSKINGIINGVIQK